MSGPVPTVRFMTTRGRRRRPIGRYAYMTALTPDTISTLEHHATRHGLSRSLLIDLLISATHGYHGTHLPDAALLGLDQDQLDACVPHNLAALAGTRPVLGRQVIVRVDEPLAEHINALCRAHGVRYGAYLRHVLTHALTQLPTPVTARSAQPQTPPRVWKPAPARTDQGTLFDLLDPATPAFVASTHASAQAPGCGVRELVSA